MPTYRAIIADGEHVVVQWQKAHLTYQVGGRVPQDWKSSGSASFTVLHAVHVNVIDGGLTMRTVT